ncbi:MAG TPA: hypothetical protein VFZ75_09985 [Actinomycetota bacterium]|nr:hypothetical protein [Actinomycetota bacterium]
MSLLRRTLSVSAVLLLGLSIPLVLFPGWVVEGVMGQEPTDEVWLRLLGTAGIALALFHVLVLRKLDDLWWWTWAFVLFDGVSAVIVLLHTAVGLPPGSSAWPWWAYGLGSAAFAALFVAGLAKAGQERPFA